MAAKRGAFANLVYACHLVLAPQPQHEDVWSAVFEFLPPGQFLQVASVSSAWRELYTNSLQHRALAQPHHLTSSHVAIASMPLAQWALASGCPRTEGVLALAARRGALDVLQHLLGNSCAWPGDPRHVCAAAAGAGHLHVLRWVHVRNPGWEKITCAAAARGGHLEVLQWARAHGCGWDTCTCEAAARNGHLRVLQWARANGCPWGYDTCREAARGGHLEVLQWARANRCPWRSDTCGEAAHGGHMEVLQWAHANGCQWSWDTCWHAAQGGHLDMLQFAHANGCPIDAMVVSGAASGGHLHVLRWLHAIRSCPWDASRACAQQLPGSFKRCSGCGRTAARGVKRPLQRHSGLDS